MARFTLREFSRPDYASHLPKHDPNNAIWPRISMLMKMLNEIPWFSVDEDEQLEKDMRRQRHMENLRSEIGDKLDREESAQAAHDAYVKAKPRGAGSIIPTVAEPLMEPSSGDEEPENVSETAQAPSNDVKTEDEKPDVAESDPTGFEPTGASAQEIQAMQAFLNERGYGLAADGIWGPKSKNAYSDFLRKSETDRIKALQTDLNSRGANLAVDGLWGPKTEAAYAKDEMERELAEAARLNNNSKYRMPEQYSYPEGTDNGEE